ncbi:ABC transporter permease [Paramicrobacterium agarici]|uniref:Putative ABC transport system permease protein n=1 Tax=Paramicrobacterium agarici TaxID=630514 RepID=A0A2A9DXE2_9MICO|nr:FtsX-like permease family protein [Microbacterium agarici]PFG30662.1 putative ABC transport system permease protein [Microbacterium agarici]
MWTLARSSAAHHRRSVIGVIVAVLLASALTTALGVLIESGLRGGVPVQRFAAADVVVGAPQSQPVPDDVDVPFPERALLPQETVDSVEAVPGVDRAIADATIPLVGDDGTPISGHAWASSSLTPFAVTTGEPPTSDGQVVLTESADASVGDSIALAHGGVATTYTVSGIATAVGTEVDRPQAFLTQQALAALWPHAGSVDLIGVIGDEGTDAAALAAAISDAVPGTVTYTGTARGDVETLEGATARTNLIALSGSLAGVALIIALFVVASTMSLSLGQRRRDIALLRAVGAESRQIRGLVVREAGLIALAASVVGVLPGYGLAQLLGDQFAASGLISTDFALAFSPLPAIGAVVLMAGTSLLAGLVSARRPSRMAPVDALGDAHVETPALSSGRVITGVTLIAVGLVASLLPLVIPGEAALAGPASAALAIIIGAALLGPRIVEVTINAIGPVLRRMPGAASALADANARSFTRRLATALVPLALGITLAIVQLFVPATVASEAAAQSVEGTTADLVVTAPTGGLAPSVTGDVTSIEGVDAVTPIVRSSVLVNMGVSEFDVNIVEPTPIQGINPATASATLDLGVTAGSLVDLSGADTIAISDSVAYGLRAGVGDTIDVVLGDGDQLTATIVATYERGLGFGDYAIDASVLRQHTTTGLNDQLLVLTNADTDAVATALADRGLRVTSGADLGAAGAEEAAAQSWASIVALMLILGFIALAVVNTLVMATTERRAEFALLRRLGATPGQVSAMTFIESAMISVLAVVLGTVITLPPLAGIAFAISGQPLPTFPPVTFALLAGATLLLGILSIVVPTRSALRAPLTSSV